MSHSLRSPYGTKPHEYASETVRPVDALAGTSSSPERKVGPVQIEVGWFLPGSRHLNNITAVAGASEREDMPAERLHDPLVFFGVAVSVIYVGDAILLMVGDPVHRIAPELQTSDGAECSS